MYPVYVCALTHVIERNSDGLLNPVPSGMGSLVPSFPFIDMDGYENSPCSKHLGIPAVTASLRICRYL